MNGHEMINSFHSRRTSPGRFLNLIAMIGAGTILAVMFLADIYLSKRTLTALILIFTIWGWRAAAARNAPLAILPRFMIFVYVLPFSITVGYLFSKDYMWVFVPLQVMAARDDILVRQMLTIGLVGLIGLVVGVQLAGLLQRGKKIVEMDELRIPPAKTLDPAIFISLLAIPLFTSWLSAPSQTIMTSAYATGPESTAEAAGFGAAAKLGYAFLLILLIDLQRETNAWRHAIKNRAWLAAFGIVVVFFQIMRGDRDCASMIAAAAFIYMTSPITHSVLRERVAQFRKRARKMALPMILIVVLFQLLGAVRSNLADVGAQALEIDPSRAVQLAFQQTTWTAVCWTNLAAAYEYRTGAMEYHYGQTYVDYAASLMPGFIAKAIGFDRPLESWRGPAWEVGRSITTCGGIHADVVPFWNFGIFGAFFILMFYGYIVGRVEIVSGTYKLWPRLLWAGLLLSSFEWFWYGDMIFIRSLMAVGLAGLTYQVALALRVLFVTYAPIPYGRLTTGAGGLNE